jgi:hypothetical protein
VTLINTNGMTFIGPGSEWFWTAVSGLVLAVTFFLIYRQLSIARSANAFEQLNRITNEFDSERMTRHTLEIYLALQQGVNPENIPEGAASVIADFWEGVGALVRGGHVDRRLVHDSSGSRCRWWWAALAPNTRRFRIETGESRSGEHFEWLAGVMAEMDREAGVGPQYDEAYLLVTLDRRIQKARDQIRLMDELRAVIVRPMPPAVPPAPPPAAQRKRRPSPASLLPRPG